MEKLTEKQNFVYQAIKYYISKYGFSPTIRELCEMVGVSSTGTIHVYLKTLKKKGYIDYIYNRNRTITIKK